MKEGNVIIIGRPNVGKSTFLNNIIGQKIAITSPKPQTTRFPIQAVYSDKQGNIIFLDTPGVFGKATDLLSKKINRKTLDALNDKIDLLLYMIDHTRRRDFEEARVLGIVRKIKKPKILAINKIDKKEPTYLPQYKFLFSEFDDVHLISALKGKHIKPLIDAIFSFLPEVKESSIKKEIEDKPVPVLNINSKIYLQELIREKIFLQTRQEVPYTTTVFVEKIENKPDVLYIKARIITTSDRYKRMLIGKGGRKIKEIGRIARKELELATGQKVFLELEVETNPHWQEEFL